MYKNSSITIPLLILYIFYLKIVEIISLTFPIRFSSISYINYLKSQNDIKEELNVENIMNYIFHNKIISSITIGNPTQKMMIFFNNEENSFYLSKDPDINNDNFLYEHNLKYNFARILSSTFILKNSVKYDYRRYNLVYLAQDQISFDDKSKYEFYFLIDNDIQNKPIYFGIAGIGLDKEKEKLNYPKFLNQLYEQGIINNYYWYINYDANKLLIGEEYDIKDKSYQEILTKPFVDIYDNIVIIDWNILFNEIYVEKDEQNKHVIHSNSSNPQGNINIDYGFIIGTPLYRMYLNEKFFDQLINEKKCYEHIYRSKNRYKSDYYLYSCNKTFEPEIRHKFQTIKFISKEYNYTFELNYQDVFMSIYNNNILLFMIVFEVIDLNTINYNRWILGEPFLKKYKFLFNPGKKTITFKKEILINKNSQINLNINIKTIIIIFIILFIFLFIAFKIIKTYKIKFHNNNININNKNFYTNMNGKHDINNNTNQNNITEMKDSLIFINKDIKN